MRRLLVLVVALPCLLAATLAFPGAAAAVQSPGTHRWALIVGVGQFQGRTPSLPGSAGDAVDTTRLLLSNGWSPAGVLTLVDRAATTQAVQAGLDWLAGRCGPGSECVFKYSGHVKQFRANDGDAERLDEGLWLYDNGTIADGWIAERLRRLQGRAWIDISGCEAGGFDDNVSGSNRVFTGSSGEHEKSYESPAYGNSVWTEHLVNRGLAQGLNLADAFAQAAPRAAKETAGQRRGPQNAYMAGGDPSSWFHRPKSRPAAAPVCYLLILCT